MREYIDLDIRIDGRTIPYPVFTSCEYFASHDNIDDVDGFIDTNPEIDELVTQILALKQSCFLLRHTTYGLYDLKMKLIKKLAEKYQYMFDDEWMEKLVN